MKAKTKFNKRQVRINKFYKFLLDHDCFVEYRNNVRKSNFTDLTKLFNKTPVHWVIDAFSWRKTKEGDDYWCRINIKWDAFRGTEGIE